MNIFLSALAIFIGLVALWVVVEASRVLLCQRRERAASARTRPVVTAGSIAVPPAFRSEIAGRVAAVGQSKAADERPGTAEFDGKVIRGWGAPVPGPEAQGSDVRGSRWYPTRGRWQ